MQRGEERKGDGEREREREREKERERKRERERDEDGADKKGSAERQTIDTVE